MEIPRIFESEYKFCEILWEKEPISSGELVQLCAERLDWKKSTTYTVIKRLCERGIIQSQNAIVTSLVSKQQAQDAESKEVVEKSFGGSLPEFVASFTRQKKLNVKEIEEIRNLIDNYHE